MMLRLFLLATLSALSACANFTAVNQQPAPVERSEPDAVEAPVLVGPPIPSAQQPSDREATPSAPAPVSPRAPATASSTLLASVDAAIAAGDLERAAAVSERALRISPRDAMIWYRLASIRYEQQNYAEASGLARRALGYSGTDATLRSQINELLERLENH